MKNNINFQTFLLMHHMQMFTDVFKFMYVYLISSFLLLIYSMLSNKRDGGLGLYPFSEGLCYYIITASFLSYLFL